MYEEWNGKIIGIKRQCEKDRGKRKYGSRGSNIRKLKKEAKMVRGRKRKLMMRQYKLLVEQEEEEKRKEEGRKIQRIVEKLERKDGGVSEERFWEFKKKVQKRKEEVITSMADAEGKIVENKEEIVEVFEDFYKKLFEKKRAETETEKEAERVVNDKFEEIK